MYNISLFGMVTMNPPLDNNYILIKIFLKKENYNSPPNHRNIYQKNQNSLNFKLYREKENSNKMNIYQAHLG
jgi:hypothetical protein